METRIPKSKNTQNDKKTEIDNRNIEKTKTKYLLKGTNKWEPGKRAQYVELHVLTRKECNAIFSARTRMMNVNGNYHNRNTDPTNGNTGTYTRRMPSSHGRQKGKKYRNRPI